MKNKKTLINFLFIFIITILVLYFALKENFFLVIHEIKSVNLFWILVSILLLGGYYFFKSLVLAFFAKKFNKKYRFRNALRTELEVSFFNGITPFATGGQPYEIYSLKKKNIKLADATNISIQNFIVYQMALIIFGIISIYLNSVFHYFTKNSLLTKLIILGFIVNLGVMILLFVLTFTKKINKFIIKNLVSLLSKLKIVKDKEEKYLKIENHLSEFHSGAKILFENKIKFILMIKLQLISLACLYLIPMTLLYATKDYVSFNSIESITASAYVMIIGSFVPIPGGTGGLEFGFLAFFGNFIIGSKLNAIMILWRFITYYFGFIIGAIFVSLNKKER